MVTVAPKRHTRSPARAAIGFKIGVLGERIALETAKASMADGRWMAKMSPAFGVVRVTR